MATPTIVSTTSTADYNNGGSSAAISSIAALSGDLLLIFAAAGDAVNVFGTITATGAATLTVSNHQIQTAGSTCPVGVWSAPVTTNGNYTVTINYTSSGAPQGATVVVLRGHGGVGVSSKGLNTPSAPSLALSTGTANSMVFAMFADYDGVDGSSRTWRTINSITPTSGNGFEKLYYRNAGVIGAYLAVWSDVAATGSKTTGLSAPTNVRWSGVAIEIKPSTGSTQNIAATASDTHGATSAAKLVARPSATAADTHAATTAAKLVKHADAAATDTHGATSAAKLVKNIAATASDTHGATASMSPLLAAAATDTHGATSAMKATHNLAAAATDTHGATAAAQRTASLSATASDTHAATAAADVHSTVELFAHGTDAHGATAVASLDPGATAAEFPIPIEFAVEMAFGADVSGDAQQWEWTDVTERCFKDASPSPISIDRGRQDEMSQVQPGSCSIQFDNPDGALTPGNAASPYHPYVRLGTPLRVTVLDDDLPRGYTNRPGSHGYVYADDTPAMRFTGDLDLTVRAYPDEWFRSDGHGFYLATRHESLANMAWCFYVGGDGKPALVWTTSGDYSTHITAHSTAPVPALSRDHIVRVTLDVNNGAGGWTVTFYAGLPGGTLNQLGAQVTGSGVTSVAAALGAPLTVGAGYQGLEFFSGIERLSGSVSSVTLKSGIGGTTVASPDFAGAMPGVTLLYDLQDNPWVLRDDGAITDSRVRFIGHVAEIAPTWPYGDLSDGGERDGESRVAVQAAGILRRLGQSGSPVHSALYRGLTSGLIAGVEGYWPMEDSAGSTTLAAPLGDRPATISSTGVELAAFSDVPASEPLPTFSTGSVTAPVDSFAATGYVRAMCYFSIPSGGTSGTVDVMRLNLSGGSLRSAVLQLTSAGDLQLVTTTTDGTASTEGPIAFGIEGKQGLIWVYAIQDGSATDVQFGVADLTSTAVVVWDYTLALTDFGSISSVRLGGNGNLESMALGHLVVLSTDEFWDVVQLAKGYAGETALDRLKRLGTEENILIGHRQGDAADYSTKMGPQRTATVVELLRECADADGGVLYEPRDYIGLAYRVRYGLYDQPVSLPLDAARENRGDIVNPFSPVLDDALTRNEVTVSRDSGSSFVASDAADILTRGLYATSDTLNIFADGELSAAAGWALHLGTWDGMRYPQVSPAIEVMGDLLPRWSTVDVGDVVTVDNLPPQHPVGAVALMAQGFTEMIDPRRWLTTINASPAGSWTTGFVWDGTSEAEDFADRMDTEASELADDVSSTATSLSIATTVGPVWMDSATYPDDFPVLLDLEGEHVLCTAITGTTSPQTATVTRSLNGIVKAHSAGATVALAVPAYVAR